MEINSQVNGKIINHEGMVLIFGKIKIDIKEIFIMV